jgi:NADPH-dependent ferric siderophore reductase
MATPAIVLSSARRCPLADIDTVPLRAPRRAEPHLIAVQAMAGQPWFVSWAAVTAPVVRRSPVHTGEVVAARELTPRMRRVTVRSQAMVGAVLRPAQDVELHLAEPSGRRVKRRYTIRHHRPDPGEIDLDVVLHGAGPGAAWGAAAAPGDEIRFQGPRGKLELRPAPVHLLVGDESALPAIAVIAEALPAGERAVAVVEVADAAEEQSISAELFWVHRDGRAPGTPDLLRGPLDEVDLPLGDARAYLLGETRSMVALRAQLEDRGIAHDSIFVKGYWNQGRPDRIAGRSPR